MKKGADLKGQNIPRDDNQQAIHLTKEQYLTLAKAVYLGNWVVNSRADGTPGNRHNQEFEDIENTVLSFGKKFGYDQYIDDELADTGQYFPTRKFEEETDTLKLLDEYDEFTFWDELIERLAEREFQQIYNRSQIRAMSELERMQKRSELIYKWAQEIEENGLDNLHFHKKSLPEQNNG